MSILQFTSFQYGVVILRPFGTHTCLKALTRISLEVRCWFPLPVSPPTVTTDSAVLEGDLGKIISLTYLYFMKYSRHALSMFLKCAPMIVRMTSNE